MCHRGGGGGSDGGGGRCRRIMPMIRHIFYKGYNGAKLFSA